MYNTGLKIIPTFQENYSKAERFTYSSGYDAGMKAITAATQLRIPITIIYFAVDFDATEAQAKTVIKEFFQGINEAKEALGSAYLIGIYLARNTCDIICRSRLAVSCYVSDMSTTY